MLKAGSRVRRHVPVKQLKLASQEEFRFNVSAESVTLTLVLLSGFITQTGEKEARFHLSGLFTELANTPPDFRQRERHFQLATFFLSFFLFFLEISANIPNADMLILTPVFHFVCQFSRRLRCQNAKD